MDTKPKLIFFQYRYGENLPEFLLIHKRKHVKCLSQFFDVVVINEDCDYGQVCDQHQPDVTLFESGVPLFSCQRPQVRNIQACPQVPRLGFLHADGFSEGRAGFLSDMDHWGIDTFFAIATTAAEHMPAIADRLFIWPTFADAGIFHDYGQWKNIPVLFTGNKNALYPWRHRIIKVVTKYYPSLVCPHPGYSPRKAATQVMTGVPYARMLNASWFVPACGTVAREVVRKHFEVPASKACLVTEQSPALEAAGFVDMRNCVFADDHNILEKIEYLFRHPDELNAIIDAGYQLVHSRHTLKHRDQMFQWFKLRQTLKSGQRIVQRNPFEPLQVVEGSPARANSHVIPSGWHLALLRQGDEKLWKGDLQEAESAYLKCLNYYGSMPEPLLRLALCNLYKGNAAAALSWIVKPIEFTLAEYKAADPDPVEWAYLIVSLLGRGKVDEAVRRGSEFPWLHHPELDRVRWAANLLHHHGQAVLGRPDEALTHRVSIHQLPIRSVTEWTEQLCIMLRACGQPELADRLVHRFQKSLSEPSSGGADAAALPKRGESPGAGRPGRGFLGFARRDSVGMFSRRRFYSKARMRVKHWLGPILHRLEAKYGDFLPYRLSNRKSDHLFSAVQGLAQDEDVKTALIVGAASQEGVTEAVLAGALENRNKPSVFCISGPRPQSVGSDAILPNRSGVKSYRLADSSPETFSAQLEETVRKIKEENQINCFDVLLIDGSELGRQSEGNGALDKDLADARFVVLNDISGVYNHRNYSGLLNNSQYVLVDHNPALRDGYAIFEKQSSGNGSGPKAVQSNGDHRAAADEPPCFAVGGAALCDSLPEPAPPASPRAEEARHGVTGDA